MLLIIIMNNNIFFKNNYTDKYNPDIHDKYNKLKSNRNIKLDICNNQKPYKPIIYDNQPKYIKSVDDLKIPIEKTDTSLLMNSYQLTLDNRLNEKKQIENNIKNNPDNKTFDYNKTESNILSNQYEELKNEFKVFSNNTNNNILDKQKINSLIEELNVLLKI